MTSKFRSGLTLSFKAIDLCQKRPYCDGRPKGNLFLNRALNLVYESVLFVEKSSRLTQVVAGGAIGWVSGHCIERKLGFYGTLSLGIIYYLFVVARRRKIIHVSWQEVRRSLGKHYEPFGKGNTIYFKRGLIGGFLIGLLFQSR